MSYATAFPDFNAGEIPPLLLRPEWRDASWRNDQCPFFVHEKSGVGVWVNYADVDKREYPECLQFTAVQLSPNTEHGWQHGDDVVLFETEDMVTFLLSIGNFTGEN